MSSIVSVTTKVRDPVAVDSASRLGLPEPVHGTAELFSDRATGLLVTLPGWLDPVVCVTATGELKFDNDGGLWGPQDQLDRGCPTLP